MLVNVKNLVYVSYDTPPCQRCVMRIIMYGMLGEIIAFIHTNLL
jgi:hypothetical protein